MSPLSTHTSSNYRPSIHQIIKIGRNFFKWAKAFKPSNISLEYGISKLLFENYVLLHFDETEFLSFIHFEVMFLENYKLLKKIFYSLYSEDMMFIEHTYLPWQLLVREIKSK